MSQVRSSERGTRSDEQRKRPWWKVALRIVLILGLTYVLVLAYFLVAEDSLVYRAYSAEESWHKKPATSVEDVWLELDAGERVHAWWCPREGATEAILVCHGNGGNLSNRASQLVRFGEALDRSILIFDYPGYGKSTGDASEEGCYASAEAAFEWLTNDRAIEPGRIAIYGESLGGGAAVELAVRRDAGALVLVKSFSSLPSVAGEMYPFLPTRWLMKNRFESAAKIGGVTEPVLIAGATGDSLVPFKHSEELYDAAREPKALFRLEGQDHNDAVTDEFLTELDAFLDEHLE